MVATLLAISVESDLGLDVVLGPPTLFGALEAPDIDPPPESAKEAPGRGSLPEEETAEESVETPVRSWRRVLRFRRAPPGPVLRAFARGWVGSRYRAGKRMGGGLQLGSPRNPLRAGWLPSLPLVGRGDFPQPQKLRPHS